MPTWEETKRAGQTAFISRGNGFQDVHDSISDMYRQILSTGHIYPSTGAESLTRQIAEGNIDERTHHQSTAWHETRSTKLAD